MDNILASSIKDKAHLAAFDEMMAERFYDLDLTPLIPNIIQTAPLAALPYLAIQFGVTGYNGWRYADTEQKQRDLLKTAVELKKYKGTVWSIKEALKLIGITPIEFRKGMYRLYPNGEQFCNGSFACGSINPFTIQISVNSSDFANFTEQIAADMLALILEYKSGRDLLTSVNVEDGIQADTFGFTDSLSIDVDNGVTIVNHVL